MVGLPPAIYRQLRTLLIDRDEFCSNEALRTFFKNPRLVSWRTSLPEFNSIDGRITNVIGYLLDQYNVEGQNALALFLYALAQTEPEKEKAQQLADLVERVRYASIEGRITEYSKEIDKYDVLERAGNPLSNYITQQRLRLRESIQKLQEEMTQRGFPPLGENALQSLSAGEKPSFDSHLGQQSDHAVKPLKD